MTKTYSVLIVGAGRIGASFDTPASVDVLTHAHVFTEHPGFRLAGFVDADRDTAERAANLWGAPAFGSVAEANADLVVVAVPDEHHYAVVREVAAQRPRLIFCEKPLAKTLAQAEELVELSREVPIAVNFSRRYLPALSKLRDSIAAGELGRFSSGSGLYGKGTLHNGSHLVDLLGFLFGEVVVERGLGYVHDFTVDDPTCSALLTLGGGSFVMRAVDSRWFTIFELDLVFERARIRLVDSAHTIEMSPIVDSPIFKGYRVLGEPLRSPGTPSDALRGAARALYAHLDERAGLPCTAGDGLRAMTVCAAIVDGCR